MAEMTKRRIDLPSGADGFLSKPVCPWAILAREVMEEAAFVSVQKENMQNVESKTKEAG